MTGTAPGRRRGALAAFAGAVGALALAGCGNQMAAQQSPAPVTGTVTSRPNCRPGQACPFLVALVPDALVVATGKDGAHEVHADAHGHFQIYLLEGLWTLKASRADSSTPGPGVTVDLSAGQSRQVNLQVAADTTPSTPGGAVPNPAP